MVHVSHLVHLINWGVQAGVESVNQHEMKMNPGMTRIILAVAEAVAKEAYDMMERMHGHRVDAESTIRGLRERIVQLEKDALNQRIFDITQPERDAYRAESEHPEANPWQRDDEECPF